MKPFAIMLLWSESKPGTILYRLALGCKGPNMANDPKQPYIIGI
jgi:hypothetical protein